MALAGICAGSDRETGRQEQQQAATAVTGGFHLIEGMVACPAHERLVTGNGDRPAAHVTSAGKGPAGTNRHANGK